MTTDKKWLFELLEKHRTNPKTIHTGIQWHNGWDHIRNTIGMDNLDDFIKEIDIIIPNNDFWDWRTGNRKTLNEKAVWIKEALEYEMEECWACSNCGKSLDCYTDEKEMKAFEENICEYCKSSMPNCHK